MSEFQRVAGPASRPNENGERLHVLVQGRYLSIICWDGKLHCLDSSCCHAGGPLALGDIEVIEARACLTCPWHYSKNSLETGEKFFQTVDKQSDGQMIPGAWKSMGPRQRTHSVEERDDGIYIRVNTEGTLQSDEYATLRECGERVLQGHLRRGIPGYKAPEGGVRQPPGLTLHGPAAVSEEEARSPHRSIGEGEDVWPEHISPPTPSRRRGSLHHKGSLPPFPPDKETEGTE